jgi:FtsZ-binding cell division protein ZapB
MVTQKRPEAKLMAVIAGLFFLVTGLAPGIVLAQTEVEALKQQMQQLSEMMQAVQKKLDTIETKTEKKDTEIKEIDQRLNKAEMHTASDKIGLGLELRSRAESIHYDDMRTAPSALFSSFFTPAPQGFNGATGPQIQQAIAGMVAAGMVPPPQKADIDNDIIYTNKFRLNMMAKVNDQLNFAGRLAAYKVFGDSTEVKFNNGSLGDVTFDGNTASLPHGDTIRLERAYFNYKNQAGEVPINVSFGRRPSTDGPPLEYGNYSLEAGSPLAHIINWQFDGASLSFGLEEMTGIPGFALKLCYGVGFESDWGNSGSLSSQSDVDDVHLMGFIATLYDDEVSSAELNYAHASDITDGFTGLTVMPFIVSVDGSGAYTFSPNSGAFISRMEPTTNLGNWDAATLLMRTNLMERFEKDIDLFLSLAWTHTDPDTISRNPFYNLLGYGLLSSNGKLEAQDGYGLYAGAIFPMPFDARLGVEYNYGSRYWFNFTGAEDSLIASKLATRGQVWETYYLQPIFKDNFFLKLGGQYYDYEYTGSGNPLGRPVKISDATALDTLFPVVDKVWNLYLSATLRY